MNKKKFRIPVSYIFTGEFFISASSQAVAEKFAEKHCGVVLGHVHSTLPDEDVNWNFSNHPDSKVGNAVLCDD